MKNGIRATIGVDIGDRFSHLCEVNEETGEIVREEQFPTTREGMVEALGPQRQRVSKAQKQRVRVILEVGAHSPWMSRILHEMGHEVVVANARELRFIFQSRNKSDRVDAQKLASVGRFDTKLLKPIQHRSEEQHLQMAMLRARDALVTQRARLVVTLRGLGKSLGMRLPASSTPAFASRTRAMNLPSHVAAIFESLLIAIDSSTQQIRVLDAKVKEVAARPEYAGVRAMKQVQGVGDLTALAVLLVLQDPKRFRRSRDAAAYLGLTPGRDQSGAVDRKVGITKQGDPFVRRLLVQSAHYILGQFGDPCDLRSFGERLMARGMPKKKAVTAVARKLAVLLHRLWQSSAPYQPQYRSTKTKPAPAAA